MMKIAGVPEHFNLPIRLCLEQGWFSDAGLEVAWTDVPEGTGKLCQMLRSGETDMAVILTEGIIKDLNAGNPSKIVQIYVNSPLLWGVHVNAKSPFQINEDLFGKKVAISRYGSGSELMAYVNASNHDWPKESLSFEVVNTLDGAVEALSQNKADYFMWERFMTQPIVDKGIFRRIGICPTPWPSFVIAVRNSVLEDQPQAVQLILDTINRMTAEFKNIEDIDRIIAERFDQKLQDVQQWLDLTRWTDRNFSSAEFEDIQNQLVQLGIMDRTGHYSDLVKA